MDDDRERRPWLDELNRKHECGPSLSPYRTLELIHEGKPVQVAIPDNLHQPERLEIRTTLGNDRHLALIGWHAMTLGEGEDYERGILMLARRDGDGPYVVHVWHEMYPWALEYLGLGASSPH